jgi:hypothetical protein
VAWLRLIRTHTSFRTFACQGVIARPSSQRTIRTRCCPIAKRFVKSSNLRIRGPDHHDTGRLKPILGCLHHPAPQPGTLKIACDRQIVQLATMSIVSGHGACHDAPARINRNQNLGGSASAGPFDIPTRYPHADRSRVRSDRTWSKNADGVLDIGVGHTDLVLGAWPILTVLALQPRLRPNIVHKYFP